MTSGVDQPDGPKAKAPPAPPKPPEGVSQFLTKVLDQLSLSAWLPSALLVGAGAVILEARSQPTVNLIGAVEDLTAKPLGVLIVLLFALVLGTMITQAFELPAIRTLEGYWPRLASSIGVTGALVRLQANRRRRAIATLSESTRLAFSPAREVLLDNEVPWEVITYFKRVVNSEDTSGCDAGVVLEAKRLTWERFSPPELLRAMEAAQRRTEGYPAPHRLMPTLLGNTLRAAEDGLRSVKGGPLRSFVSRNWHLVPTELRLVHDEYRTRLDMYCCLVFVCVTLGVAGPALLLIGHSHNHSHQLAGAATFLGFALLGIVSYRAAIAAARGYGGALRSIDTVVLEAAQHVSAEN